ncbi:hypothetical protein ALC56_15162 [Trachymyrmex septentrionalis]|uniref:Uncharacterized protein n=1 Tax=Trachymyrmex septentrionalis TaxID=34720 RepID=A0A195EQL4_9HYME|nr:hypothetical protein ALC56_15162 [Trachymyrmex septentrionalis]
MERKRARLVEFASIVSKYASRAVFKYIVELSRNENTNEDVRFGFYEKWVKAMLPQPRPMV